MHTNTSKTAAIEAIIDRARQQLKISSLAAQAVLGELWRLIATQLASDLPNPFTEVDWYSRDMGFVLEAWREGIKEWTAAGFQGMTPRQIAIAAVLDDVAHDADGHGEHEIRERQFDGVAAGDFIRKTCIDVFGIAGESVADATVDNLPSQVQEIQYAEAMARGIPHGVHTEFCWVPSWDGDSLDELLDDFTIPTSGIHRGIEDVIPSKGLANLLKWANLSTYHLIDAAKGRNERQGEKLSERLKGFEVNKDYSRPQMLSAEELIDIIENSTCNSVPVVHCEVDVDALLKLDPRQAFALPLRGGRMHVGLHDFMDGAGHMDCYFGTPVVPSMALGFAWPGRWRYGINTVYGIVKHPFNCRPQAVGAPQRELLAA